MPAPHIPAAPAAPHLPLPAPQAPPGAPAPGTTGTAASRRLLNPDVSGRPIALWGSSSMSSEGGADATPIPVRIHSYLDLAAGPGVVHGFGVGATVSAHTLLMRGLDRPQVEPTGPPRDDGAPVILDSGLEPAGPITIPGTLGAVRGVLDGSSGIWRFQPDDHGTTLRTGTFASTLPSAAPGARQVLWMGKNNILDVDGVLEDTQRVWDAADTPDEDTIVLGQWPTEDDPHGSATADALDAVNAEQSRRYGARFLDLRALLATPEGLRCSPIAPVQIFEQGGTAEALERGIVPPALVAEDALHLNGWGNLAVGWALIQRMRELAWL